MKKDPIYSKTLKTVTILTIAIFTVLLINNHATKAQTIVDTTSATSIGNTLNGVPATNTANIREKLRADLESKAQNLKINQETRNILTEKRISATTSSVSNNSTSPRIVNTINKPPQNPAELKARLENERRLGASTTPMMRRDGQEDERTTIRQKKENVAKQLEVAVKNLTELRKRIGSRIEKDQQSGRDMTKAKQLLGIADTKLIQLKTSMDTLKAYSTASTTDSTNLDSARKLINDVQKTIKYTHQSLNDVVVAIAQAMGLKNGTASSTTAQ
ncbi:MAG: hypothetical protein WCS89_02735 [Candidatus Paceibacterota bacterium]|jgi:hypothetical protein